MNPEISAARKTFQEVINGIPCFQMVKQTLHGHTCANKNRRSPQNLGIAMNDALALHRARIRQISFQIKTALSAGSDSKGRRGSYRIAH